MYFQNISERVTVVVSTVIGKVGVAPGEVVCINEKILPPLSTNLRQVSELEYKAYKEKELEKNNTTEIIPPAPDNILDDNLDADVANLDAQSFINALLTNGTLGLTGQVIDNPEEVINETTIEETVTTVEEDKKEEITETVNIEEEIGDQITVTSTDELTELQKVEQQINDLQETWLVTKQIKKKEKIQKEIVKLQKQLKRLQEKEGIVEE